MLKKKFQQIQTIPNLFSSLLQSLSPPLPPFLTFLFRLMLPEAGAKENVRDYLIAQREVIHWEELLFVEPPKSDEFATSQRKMNLMQQLLIIWEQPVLVPMFIIYALRHLMPRLDFETRL